MRSASVGFQCPGCVGEAARTVRQPVTVAPTSRLNFKHTIFGEVADQPSRDVVDAIAAVSTGAQDRPVTPVEITGVTVTRG